MYHLFNCNLPVVSQCIPFYLCLVIFVVNVEFNTSVTSCQNFGPQRVKIDSPGICSQERRTTCQFTEDTSCTFMVSRRLAEVTSFIPSSVHLLTNSRSCCKRFELLLLVLRLLVGLEHSDSLLSLFSLFINSRIAFIMVF